MKFRFIWLALALMVSVSVPAVAQDSSVPGAGPTGPASLAPIALPPPPDGIIFVNGGVPDDSNGNEMTQWLQTEDFALESDGCVSDVHFVLGEIFGGEWEGTLEYFFFADSGGVPGALVASGSAQSIDANSLGATGGWDDLIYVSFLTEAPVCFSGSTTYWLGLHGNGDDYATRDNVYWVIGTAGFGSTGVESFYGTQDNWLNNALHHWFVLTEPTVDWSPASPGIANGSFELPILGADFVEPATDITDWVIEGNVGHIRGYWPAPEGAQSVDMNGDLTVPPAVPGAIRQTLSGLDDGHPYRVTFMMAGNPEGGEAVKNLRVGFNGTSSEYEFDTSSDCGGPCSTSDMGWTGKVFEFVAPGSSIDLTFTSLEATESFGPALDDVKLFFGNRAPVAVDDPGVPEDFTTDEDTAFTTGDVTDNDLDADGDDLTVCAFDATGVVGILTQNGNAFDYDPNDQFEYLADGESATETFTYQVSDGYAGCTSNSATVTITITGVNDAPVMVSVSPETSTVDYSDYIAEVTITATDIDTDELDLSVVSGNPDFTALDATDGSCTGEHPATCTWTFNGQVDVPGYQVFHVDFQANDGEMYEYTSSCTQEDGVCRHVLTVDAEDATVWLDPGNATGQEVAEPEGASGEFWLSFWAWEQNDEVSPPSEAAYPFDDLSDYSEAGNNCGRYPGDPCVDEGDFDEVHVDVAMRLVPIGPGSGEDGDCDVTDHEPAFGGAGYGQYVFVECKFDEVAVNTYIIEAMVGTDNAEATDVYYFGVDEDAFVVYDPSLGFTTGGGWFYWPGTEVDSCLAWERDVCVEPNDDPCAGYPGDKTNFGYTMKYNKKGTNVQGSALVMRHASAAIDDLCVDIGNYRVKSNALYGLAIGSESGEPPMPDMPVSTPPYGWASFAGKATYREPGIDNEGNHQFFIYVEDYGDQGCGQEFDDRFWVEVWDKDDVPVMLPLMGMPAVDNAVDIECGNIFVPHKTGSKGGGKPPK